MIERAIGMMLAAIPVASVGAISDHLEASPRLIALLMIITAIIVCGLMDEKRTTSL